MQRRNKKRKIFPLAFTSFLLALSGKIFAVCPICAIAVGAGVGLDEYLGIDDSITGLWVGVFILLISYLTWQFLERKRVIFPLFRLATLAFYYLIGIVPLYLIPSLHPKSGTIWGIDRFFAGLVIGSILAVVMTSLYEFMKKNNGGKPHFPYEKVVMLLAALLVVTILFAVLLK